MPLSTGPGRGRGGDDGARIVAEAQAQLEHVPGILGLFPFGELVAPGDVVLRAAKQLGPVAGEELGHGAAPEAEEAVARTPFADAVAGDLEEAAGALDHHPAGLGQSGGDERDVDPAAGLDLGLDPFGAGEGLAEASAAHDDAGGPPPLGRELAFMRPAGEVAVQGVGVGHSERAHASSRASGGRLRRNSTRSRPGGRPGGSRGGRRRGLEVATLPRDRGELGEDRIVHLAESPAARINSDSIHLSPASPRLEGRRKCILSLFTPLCDCRRRSRKVTTKRQRSLGSRRGAEADG